MITARTLYLFDVAKIADHTPTIRELFLKLKSHDNFQFKAGQFVTLHVPTPEKPTLRAYSIASPDSETKGFRLIFKHVENGIASTYIWGLNNGAELKFTGPFGKVLFKEPATKQNIFLSTGSGLSQHFSFVASKAKSLPECQFKMLVGVRNESEIYYQQELRDLKNSLPNFQFEFVLSRPSETWTGKKGYVQHFLPEYDYLNIPSTIYLCGNGGMIKDVKKKLLEEQGFDRTKILAEAFD